MQEHELLNETPQERSEVSDSVSASADDHVSQHKDELLEPGHLSSAVAAVEAAKTQVPQNEVHQRSMCTSENIVLLGLVPFLDQLRTGALFTAMPLHFFASGWHLMISGTVLSASYILRVLVVYAVRRLGDSVCIIAALAGVLISAPMVIFPGSLPVVCVNGVANSGLLCTVAFRSMLYRQFNRSSEARVLALRAFNLADVLGYSTGSLVGGFLYEFFGFRAFAAFQFIVFALLALLDYSLPLAQADLQSLIARFRDKCLSLESRISSTRSSKSPHRSFLTEWPSPFVNCPRPALPPRMWSCCPGTPRPSTSIFLPVSITLLASCTNIFGYDVEWSLYAVYFKQAHRSKLCAHHLLNLQPKSPAHQSHPISDPSGS